MKYELVCIFTVLFLFSGLILLMTEFYNQSIILMGIGVLLLFYEMRLYDELKGRNSSEARK